MLNTMEHMSKKSDFALCYKIVGFFLMKECNSICEFIIKKILMILIQKETKSFAKFTF